MLLTKSLRSRRQGRSRRCDITASLLAASAPALLALLGATPIIASASSASLQRRSDLETSPLRDIHDDLTTRKDQLLPDASDGLNRRKHIAFQYADQQQTPPNSNLDKTTSSPTLRHDNLPSERLGDMLDAEAEELQTLPSDSFSPLLDEFRPAPQRSSGLGKAYNNDLVGKQTGSGYVFGRPIKPQPYISSAGAALVTLFSRRDSPLVRPPLLPNSNSRLLIALVIICIVAVGVLTLAAQEAYRRLRGASQPRSPLRRRPTDGRPTRTSYRNDPNFTSLTTLSTLAPPSLEDEEERIKTPPTLSRRSSAATSSLTPSPCNEGGPDSADEDLDHRTQTDLHYLSLPFGIGIGYSYANIADGGDARMRISRLEARRARQRQHMQSNSDLALSTGALPVPGTSSVNGDGLRSRSRSFKDLCRDVITGGSSRDIGMISEEEGDTDMSTVSSSRWGASLVSLDLSSSERGSGTVTPTGPSAASTLATSASSSIALEEIATSGSAAQAAKGRFFGMDGPPAPSSSHTLIDLSVGTPELAISDADGITRPSSASALMPSQVARHPQVEQLRREGRSETGKRLGKGTPTNVKPF